MAAAVAAPPAPTVKRKLRRDRRFARSLIVPPGLRGPAEPGSSFYKLCSTLTTMRTILEHFKCGLLKQKERFSKLSDGLVEVRVRTVLYCGAQCLGRRTDPAAEEPLLLLERAVLFGDQ